MKLKTRIFCKKQYSRQERLRIAAQRNVPASGGGTNQRAMRSRLASIKAIFIRSPLSINHREAQCESHSFSGYRRKGRAK